MKSIKPGRGPSGMGVAGSVIGILFGIVWMIAATSIARSAREFSSVMPIGGPAEIASFVIPFFGVLFIGAGILSAVYHYRNYRGRDRYSIVDIVDSKEEGDPAAYHANKETVHSESRHTAGKFCTECGHRLDGDFVFCPGCGRDLSKNE